MHQRDVDLRAAHKRASGNRQKSAFVLLKNSLKTVPDCSWNFSELSIGILFKIQNTEWKITIAEDQVCGFQRLKGVLTTNPEEEGVICGRFERVFTIDKGDRLR